jgi:hypothetical protein
VAVLDESSLTEAALPPPPGYGTVMRAPRRSELVTEPFNEFDHPCMV